MDDGRLEDPADAANAFNNFYIKITEKLNFQQIEKEMLPQFYKIHFLDIYRAEQQSKSLKLRYEV